MENQNKLVELLHKMIDSADIRAVAEQYPYDTDAYISTKSIKSLFGWETCEAASELNERFYHGEKGEQLG